MTASICNTTSSLPAAVHSASTLGRSAPVSATSNELIFHPLHFSLIQKELNKNTCKRRWEFSPKHSVFLMACTDVKTRRKTLELCRKYWNCLHLSSTIFLWSSTPFIYDFPLIKLMYQKELRLPSSLDELLTCSTRAAQCRFVFIYNIFLLTNWVLLEASYPFHQKEIKKDLWEWVKLPQLQFWRHHKTIVLGSPKMQETSTLAVEFGLVYVIVFSTL
jgi:hypothetical protein